MAAEPNTRCSNCGSLLGASGVCTACSADPTQQLTQHTTVQQPAVPRAPFPLKPVDRPTRTDLGFGATAGPELTGRSCPYCRFPLKEGVAIETCGSCGAVHHIECWQDNGGCSVTGCVNGPQTTTATHAVATPAAATVPAAAVPPPPPPPQKPSPPSNRHYPTSALVGAAVLVALLGAGAAVALTSSSGKHAAPTTVTVKERTIEKAAPAPTVAHATASHAPTHTSTPTPTPTPAPSSQPSEGERAAHAVAATDNYWSDIENHEFSSAYQIEQPIAQASESEWIHTEEEEGITHVSYSFSPGPVEGNEATVNVNSLQTDAAKSGCYSWTGYYRLTDYSGTWKLTHDGLERHSC